MSGSKATVISTKGKSTLVRPRFGPGMLLQHDDLEQLGTYTRELSRLLFRSFFGCGVVCGLKVTMEENCGKLCMSVDQGLALTCEGDPIYVPKKTTFAVDENCELEDTELWVVLCGTSKCCAPRTASCPTDEDESSSVCTRERDWFEIKVVREKPACVCGCDPGVPATEYKDGECQCIKSPVPDCYKDHYDGKCGCDCEGCEGNCGDCIMLAHLTRDDDEWHPDYTVRRFVRPILMRDPLNETTATTPPPPPPPPAGSKKTARMPANGVLPGTSPPIEATTKKPNPPKKTDT